MKISVTPKLKFVERVTKKVGTIAEEVECTISWKPAEEGVMTPAERSLVDALTALINQRILSGAVPSANVGVHGSEKDRLRPA